MRTISVCALALVATAISCGGSTNNNDADLTSLTAEEYRLEFEGYVYAGAAESDVRLLDRIRAQTKSALGALRTANISPNTRELRTVDPQTWVKEPVTVDGHPELADVIRVRYRYSDRALVQKGMRDRTSLPLALISKRDDVQRILQECTENSAHDREFSGDIWYVFNPSLSQCRTAIAEEQAAIDAARQALQSPGQIPLVEYNRRYLPMTVSLTPAAEGPAESYPEYGHLFSGGAKPGRLVVSLIEGIAADWAAGGPKPEIVDDANYRAYFEQQKEVLSAYSNFRLVDSDGQDLTSFTVEGKTVSGATWKNISDWHLTSKRPAGFDYSDMRGLRAAVADRIKGHWLTWEAPITVKIGDAAARDLVVEVRAYFGAETNDAPHRNAFKNSDVVLYNGHSYIGRGPLDPSRYTSNDFPSSYQLFFFNSCISFNYYEKDFFDLKGGPATLDTVTNGLESWIEGGGRSIGRFARGIIDGRQKTYRALLQDAADAAATGWGLDYPVGVDPLRVVDGELGNDYQPSTVIDVTER